MSDQNQGCGRPLNPDLRAAAAALLEALDWAAADALFMRKVPAYDPEADPHAEPVADAEELQSFYLPHRQLPPVGQNLFRELQGFLDLQVRGAPPGRPRPGELLRFHRAVDAFREWLVEEYGLRVAVPEEGKPRPSRAGPPVALTGCDREALRARVMAAATARLTTHGDRQFEAFTQEELARVVGCSQPTLNRLVKPMFGGKGWSTSSTSSTPSESPAHRRTTLGKSAAF